MVRPARIEMSTDRHIVPGLSDQMTELLTCLLHPNLKKRLTAEEAISKLRTDGDDEITRRAVRWQTSMLQEIQPVKAEITGSSGFSCMGALSPKDVLGSSPIKVGSYFSGANQAGAPRLSRYRTDFEEVEFLVSRDSLRKSRLTIS